MLSIIICSTKSTISDMFHENISKTIGVEFELVVIDNSKNTYSIFEAYNIGQQKSVFPYLCFVHEDVLFHTMNWGVSVINHLSKTNVGFVGVAGGPVMPVVPASWIGTYSVFNLIQSDKNGKKNSRKRKKPLSIEKEDYPVVVLDGFFLCARRKLFETLAFDTAMNGFHCYDLDICIQSFVKGYTNYVVYDVLIEHFSRGTRDVSYFENLLYLYKKWEQYFPLHTTERYDFYLKNKKKIEQRKLLDLIKKLILIEYDKDEINKVFLKYSGKLKLSSLAVFLFRLRFSVLRSCFLYLKK